MSRTPSQTWVEARSLLRNSAGEYLIVRAAGAMDETPWEFPGGRMEGRESAEACLRRVVREQVGAEIEILQGQPPFEYNFGTHTIRYRYCLCGILRGSVEAAGCGEARWIRPGQLREYCFDAPAQQVVDWLLESPHNR